MVERIDDDLVEEATGPTDEQLKQVTKLMKLLRACDLEVERAEKALDEAQRKRQNVAEVTLPEALISAGFTPPTKTTIAGMRLEFDTAYHASIPKARQGEAFAWLEKNGHGDLIKHEVKIRFGKNEESFFKKFIRDLAKRKKPVKAEIKDSVAPQTLGAFVREQIKEGVAIPMDILGVFSRRFASVEPIAGSGEEIPG